MSRSLLRVGAMLVAVASLPSLAAAGGRAGPPGPRTPPDKAVLDAAFKALATFDWGKDLKTVDPIVQALNASKGDAAARQGLESRLLAVLGSDAPRCAKDFVCRNLWLAGTVESVPALAALLPDKDLSHMARYALERMAFPEAGQALRDALPKATGRAKVGIINSLGMRGDSEAAAALIPLLKDADAEIASAAAAALGRAGTPETARAVTEFRPTAPKGLQMAAVDACLDAAQRLLRKGDKDEAARIYEALDAKDQPSHVRMAAFQGLVLARPAESTPMLLKALGGDNEALRLQAADLIAQVPGEEATKTFAAALPKLPPNGAVALLGALAARGDAAARPAILEAVKSADKPVRIAAVAALGATGDASDAALLAGVAASDDKEAAIASQASLVRLKGQNVDEGIVAAMKGAAPGVRAALIRALAARGAKGCVGTVTESVQDPDVPVRVAALDALAELGAAEQVPTVVKALKAARDNAERSAAERTLSALCTKTREGAAEAVIAGLEGADTPTRCLLLRALGRAGGAKALAAVRAASTDKEGQVADEAVRSLAEWPDLSAAELLLNLAKGAEKPNHQILALRGYVRLTEVEKSNDARIRMLTDAAELAKRPDEKKQILGALGNVPTPDSLKRIVAYLDDPGLIEEASAAAVKIARDVAGKNRDLVREAMTKVTEESKNKRTREDAAKILRDVKK